MNNVLPFKHPTIKKFTAREKRDLVARKVTYYMKQDLPAGPEVAARILTELERHGLDRAFNFARWL